MYLGDLASEISSQREVDEQASHKSGASDLIFLRNSSNDFVDLNESITSRQRTMFVQKQSLGTNLSRLTIKATLVTDPTKSLLLEV
jgi:hypothetical protein